MSASWHYWLPRGSEVPAFKSISKLPLLLTRIESNSGLVLILFFLFCFLKDALSNRNVHQFQSLLPVYLPECILPCLPLCLLLPAQTTRHCLGSVMRSVACCREFFCSGTVLTSYWGDYTCSVFCIKAFQFRQASQTHAV